MLKSTKRAAQFASLLLVSAAMVCLGVTGKAAAEDSQAAVGVTNSGQADLGHPCMPKAGGRVIKRTEQVADSGKSFALGEGHMPKAGGRVIRRANQATDGSTQVADSGKSFDLGEGYVPKAGGRVIRRANPSEATAQQASAEACAIEPRADTRC
jgi:hypothetical protein